MVFVVQNRFSYAFIEYMNNLRRHHSQSSTPNSDYSKQPLPQQLMPPMCCCYSVPPPQPQHARFELSTQQYIFSKMTSGEIRFLSSPVSVFLRESFWPNAVTEGWFNYSFPTRKTRTERCGGVVIQFAMN